LKIMPAEVLDPGALERLVPRLCADLPNRLALEAEQMRRVPLDLLADDRSGLAT
jgi:hypothetical protein